MKHPLFYTSLSLAIILFLVVSVYVFGWTAPTANPPSSNLPAPINTGSDKQPKSGFLAVGTTTTPEYPLEVGNQLRVWGQLISKVASGTAPFVVDSPTKVANLNADTLDGYDSADLLGGSTAYPVPQGTYFLNGGDPYYCKKKIVDTNGYATFSNINQDSICDTNSTCNNGECVSGGGGSFYCDADADGHNSSYLVSSCATPKYTKGDDCDDGCNTCYPGSKISFSYHDGHDQDCDGYIDEGSTDFLIYMTPQAYTGYQGGRSGVDNLCDLGPQLGCVSHHALVSVTTEDEIRDFPSLYSYPTNISIYWYNRSSTSKTLLANNWSDMLDGTIINSQSTGTGVSTNAWTGSNSDGSCDCSYNCGGWNNNPAQSYGQYGYASSVSSTWLFASTSRLNCTTVSMYFRCACWVGYQ